MTVDQMKNALIQVYPGPIWKKKVVQMDDKQAIAIYKNMERTGRLKLRKKKPKKEPGIKYCEQLTIWDFLGKE